MSHAVLVVPVTPRGCPPAFCLPRSGGLEPAPPGAAVGDDESQLDAVSRVLSRSGLPRAERVYATSLSLPGPDGTPFGTSVFVAVIGSTSSEDWRIWPEPGRSNVVPELRPTLDRIYETFVRATPDEALRVA